MAFSGALTLTDLNDYLGPSQACIKPVSGKDAPVEGDANGNEDGHGAASTEIAIDADGTYYESRQGSNGKSHQDQAGPSKPRERTKLETAEISLNDCLACSGCVTSAESVLIGMQSVDELRKAVAVKGNAAEQGPTHLIASIAPQSLASLSAKYSSSLESPVSLQHILARISDFLSTRMRFDVVTDTSFARHISLLEHAREYQERKDASSRHSTTPSLPMLASACPGWICYAEKTHGELLPLISKTRSPQQMAGLLAKNHLIQKDGSSSEPRRIYHMTVMPCYDKKLEASRQDFFDDVTQTRDVDLVITTGELETLMLDEGYPIVAQPVHAEPMDEDAPMTPPGSENGVEGRIASLPILLDHAGSSSGSYLFDLIERTWSEDVRTRGRRAVDPELNVKVIRSADHTEFVLRASDGSGKIIFKGAQCYGFRNLQNLVRKVQRQTGLKSKKSAAAQLVEGPGSLASRRGGAMMRGRGRGAMVRRGRGGGGVGPSPLQNGSTTVVPEDEEDRAYDYVEVMACPGGCVNGGGQLRPPGQAANAGSSALTNRSIAIDVTEAIMDGVANASVNDESPSNPQKVEQSGAQTKSLDPEGFTHGWSTPPRSTASGFDDLSSGMQTPVSGSLDEAEEPVVEGWKGTSKDWVRRVEYLYWKAHQFQQDANGVDDAGVGSVHQAQALGVPRDAIQSSIARALAACRARIDAQTKMDSFAEHVIGSMIKNKFNARDSSVDDGALRSKLLRTDYHAVQDDAVSGLAVQW